MMSVTAPTRSCVAELVRADVLTWDRVELATGGVDHESAPATAEPPGAFEAVVGHAGDHPLRAATVIEGELAWEQFLSLHAVRERLARLRESL
jgi:hypothetical protein